MKQFKWTESGLSLLSLIQREIDKNGGNEMMADKVITEAPDFFRSEVYESARERMRNRGIAICHIDREVLARRTSRICKHNPWSLTEDNFLRREMYRLTVSELGAILKRTDPAIHARMSLLNRSRLITA